MNGMEGKAIIFVGGVGSGVDRLKNFLRKSNKTWNYSIEGKISEAVRGIFGVEKKGDKGGENPLYWQAIEDIRNMSTSSFDFETVDTGKEISKFLESDAKYLVIHKSSDEMRASLAHIQDNLSCDVFRIFFGYKDDLPYEFDFNVNPNYEDFENVITRILNNEERIRM
jgi:hypothetical protein